LFYVKTRLRSLTTESGRLKHS